MAGIPGTESLKRLMASIITRLPPLSFRTTAFTVLKLDGLSGPSLAVRDLDHVLDVAVHVNDEPVTTRDFCNRSCYLHLAWPLGTLKAGDAIYVGVGPSGVDHNDRFRWGFYVVHEIEPPAAPLLSVRHSLSEVTSANHSGPSSDLRTANFSAQSDGGK